MIATHGGRFGGYGLYLSRSFNWWFHERFFRRIGFVLFVLGLLLIWLGQYRKWSSGKMRVGYGLSLLGLLGVFVVFFARHGRNRQRQTGFRLQLFRFAAFRVGRVARSAQASTRSSLISQYDGPGIAQGWHRRADRSTARKWLAMKIPNTIPIHH